MIEITVPEGEDVKINTFPREVPDECDMSLKLSACEAQCKHFKERAAMFEEKYEQACKDAMSVGQLTDAGTLKELKSTANNKPNTYDGKTAKEWHDLWRSKDDRDTSLCEGRDAEYWKGCYDDVSSKGETLAGHRIKYWHCRALEGTHLLTSLQSTNDNLIAEATEHMYKGLSAHQWSDKYDENNNSLIESTQMLFEATSKIEELEAMMEPLRKAVDAKATESMTRKAWEAKFDSMKRELKADIKDAKARTEVMKSKLARFKKVVKDTLNTDTYAAVMALFKKKEEERK